MTDSRKPSDDQVEAGAAAPRGGFKGHMQKRRCGLTHWLLYLMCTLVAIAVIVIIIFAAIVPRIVQNKMEAVTVTMDGMTVTEPRPDSYVLSINSTVRSDGGTQATVSGFKGRMYLADLKPRGEPFAIVNFPESETKDISTVNITALKRVNDLPAFTAFVTWLQNNESLRIDLEGEPTVKVSGIAWAYPANFRKTVTIKGLNGFKGQRVSDAKILKEPSSRGDNFEGIVHIPNPSVLTVQVGNASFRNFLPDGTEIGTVFIDNLVLTPGGVSIPMRANVNQAPILTAILKKPYCETGIVPFSLVGKDVTFEGTRVPYYADGLATLNSTVDINIGQAIATAFGFPIKCS